MSAKSFEQLIEQIGNMSVIELSDFIDGIKTKFNVSDISFGAGAPASGAAAPVAEEKTAFKVTLKEVGANKINVIKALRTVTPLSLTDAKKAVDEAPTVLVESASKDDAKKMKETLEAAGAKVELA